MLRETQSSSYFYGYGHAEWNEFLFKKFQKKLKKHFTAKDLEILNPYGVNYKRNTKKDYPKKYEIFKTPNGVWKIIVCDAQVCNDGSFEHAYDFFMMDIETGVKTPVNFIMSPLMNVSVGGNVVSCCIPTYSSIYHNWHVHNNPEDIDHNSLEKVIEKTKEEILEDGSIRKRMSAQLNPVYDLESDEFENVFKHCFCMPTCFAVTNADYYADSGDAINVYMLDFTKIDENIIGIYRGMFNNDNLNNVNYSKINNAMLSLQEDATDFTMMRLIVENGKLTYRFRFIDDTRNEEYIMETPEYLEKRHAIYNIDKGSTIIKSKYPRTYKMPYIGYWRNNNYPNIPYQGMDIEELKVTPKAIINGVIRRREKRENRNVIKRPSTDS